MRDFPDAEARVTMDWIMRILVSLASFSFHKPEEGKFLAESGEGNRRAFGLHGFGVFDQADGRGKLRIFKRRGQPGNGLRVGEMHRQAEDFLGEMIDPFEHAASSGEHHSRAE